MGWPGRRRAAPGLPWASCSLAILWREGLGGCSQNSGQPEPDGHTASWLLRNLGSQQQDEGGVQGPSGLCTEQENLWGPGTLGRHVDRPGWQQSLGHPEFTAPGTWAEHPVWL